MNRWMLMLARGAIWLSFSSSLSLMGCQDKVAECKKTCADLEKEHSAKCVGAGADVCKEATKKATAACGKVCEDAIK